MGTQFFVYNGDALLLTPYATERQKLKIKLPTEKIASFSSGDGVVQKGNTITYGPYTAAQALAQQPLRIHFEQPKAAITIPTLTREFQISHWLGEAKVQEDFALRNDGPKLKGHFSRLQYQQSTPYHNSFPLVKHLSFRFPACCCLIDRAVGYSGRKVRASTGTYGVWSYPRSVSSEKPRANAKVKRLTLILKPV